MIIIIKRVEGTSEEDFKKYEFSSFSEADKKLSFWSMTAPQHGGYHKCDFAIMAPESGIELKGRYDLKHWRVECANLRAHVVGSLEFLAGDSCPAGMVPERYEVMVSKYSEAERERARVMADFFKGQR